MTLPTKAAIFVAIFIADSANAYEPETHEHLSSLALARSTLQRDHTALDNFGINPDGNFPSTAGGMLTIEGLIRQGANAEDKGLRPINHFYDPYRDRALTVPLAQSSPDWALEDRGGILYGIQEFSYRKALTYLQFALSASTRQTRDDNWGRTFETLGHVVHHVQDMAQPQHVRNDKHLDRDVIGDKSLYEGCTDAAIRKPASREGCGAPLAVPEYASVTFSKARDFWTTLQSGDSYGRGRGLADFTNRNFVSKDSNFQIRNGQVVVNEDSHYLLPAPASSHTRTLEELGAPNARQVCERLRSHPRAQEAPDARCEIEFFSTDIYDAYTATSSSNELASSLSIFDQYLDLRPASDGYRTDRLFTLNRFNYAAAHPFLISRAIGYSAGLIDHFFRGRMELQSAELENDQIRIEIKNASTDGNAFGPGSFTLYYDSYDGTRKPLAIAAGAELGAGQLAPGTTHEMLVGLPEDLDLKADSPFVAVYSGIIGAEQAVSGLVFEVPDAFEGFFFDLAGVATSDRVGGRRLIYRQQGEWRLHPQGNLSSGGSVDWKGWYQNGKPTRMLTWAGRRYFYNDNLGQAIFQGGKTFAVAPYKVLGAAVQMDSSGKAWLVVICEGEEKDIVFRRPAQRSSSPALYHETLAPDGWRRVAEFANPPDLSSLRRPWLFNGDGTEAQTMRERKRTSANQRRPLTRLKITTDGVSAGLTDLGNTQVIRRDSAELTHDCEDRSGSASASHTTSVSGQNVIAVDYMDQQEVLARIEVESLVQATGEAHASGGEPYGYGGQDTKTENTRWTLKVGNRLITLFRKIDEYVKNYSVADQAGQSMHATVEQDVMVENTRPTDMDLRSGLIVLPLAHMDVALDAESFLEPGQEAISSRDQIDIASYFEYSVVADTVERDYGRANVTSSHVVTEAPPRSYYDFGDTLAVQCLRASLESYSNQYEDEVPASVEVVPAVNAEGGLFLSSAAVNRQGDIFVSMLIRDSVTKKHRFANFLSGGDAETVTGATPQTTDPFSPLFSSIAPK